MLRALKEGLDPWHQTRAQVLARGTEGRQEEALLGCQSPLKKESSHTLRVSHKHILTHTLLTHWQVLLSPPHPTNAHTDRLAHRQTHTAS